MALVDQINWQLKQDAALPQSLAADESIQWLGAEAVAHAVAQSAMLRRKRLLSCVDDNPFACQAIKFQKICCAEQASKFEKSCDDLEASRRCLFGGA
jgi:hypothetical protein